MFSNALVPSFMLIAQTLAHQNLHQFWVNGVTPGYQVGIRMTLHAMSTVKVVLASLSSQLMQESLYIHEFNHSDIPKITPISNVHTSTIQVQWDVSTHPGPITHELQGPVADVTKSTGSGTWFKIQELDYVNGQWANEVLEANNGLFSFKLPTNLPSGQYLLRSEMEALHGSQTINGTQWYIGCMQLDITGPGGTCSPTYQLPGAYNPTDSNIYISNFYYGFTASTFTAPGSAVATCVPGGGDTKPTTTKATTTPARTTTTPVGLTTKSTTTMVTTTRSTTSSVRVMTTSPKSSTTTTKTTTGGSSGGAPLYGQCGGSGWTGPTTCAQGTCTYSNAYYSQCI
ncbi:Endoglucanase-4 [Arthrobotrys entomopaga]|nr:Endoglucanase-4 [Arthrobotrys entomopaga]